MPPKQDPSTPVKRGSSPAARAGASGGALPASNKDFGDEEFEKLAYAMMKVATSHMAAIFEASPELLPWKPKGRLNDKVKQFCMSGRGGQAGVARFYEESKGVKKRTVTSSATPSPKKAKKEEAAESD